MFCDGISFSSCCGDFIEVDLEIIYALKRSSKVYFLILALQTASIDPKRLMKEGDYFCKYVFKTVLNVHKKNPLKPSLVGNGEYLLLLLLCCANVAKLTSLELPVLAAVLLQVHEPRVKLSDQNIRLLQ